MSETVEKLMDTARDKKSLSLGNERGVALLIVLLVTALLIALIFEFSYATRISLNSAANFRDSERAYFLARSGIDAFKTKGALIRDSVPQGQWLPLGQMLGQMFGDDAPDIMVKWEDESGKIKIPDVKTNPVTKEIVKRLLEEVKGIDTAVFNRMTDLQTSEINRLTLLTGLLQYMSREDFSKVHASLTLSPVGGRVNINTASLDVLQALGISAYAAEAIIEERESKPFTPADLSVTGTGRLALIAGNTINNLNIFTYLTDKSAGYYKVYAYATVGGYTKQVEAILNGNAVSYWRAL